MTDLSKLSSYGIRLFIVFGGNGGEECTYSDKQNSRYFLREMKLMSDLGLIEICVSLQPGALTFRNTTKGIDIHESLMRDVRHFIVGDKK